MATVSIPPIQIEAARPRKRRVLMYGTIVVLISFSLLAARAYLLPPALNGIVLQSATPAFNFTLQSSTGRTVSLHDFRGKYVILNFGYTSCPDVCPMQLAELKKVVAELGDKADQVQVLFVSVDPERDSPERLAAYLNHFDPTFLGLSGTPEEIAATATAFGVFYEKSQPAGATGGSDGATAYFMNHSSTVTVVDPKGYTRILYPADTPPLDIAADLAALIW